MDSLTCLECKHLDADGQCIVPLPWWLNMEDAPANVHWPAENDQHAEECHCFEEVSRG